MSNETKRQLRSAIQTFIASFVLAVLPVVIEPSWSYTGKAAIFALLLTGLRAGIKAIDEKFLQQQS